ncbi:hypothetical protein [Blastococcus sp. TF02A-35]|uniref:hypothetical protein n=1 Tax=Blastococcus sp. TF02A-35 TaxID=2559612 RepID=UPI001073DBBC|nr:hypothetical protein [Blastococcus sp. TF02A_35]TFV53001.1 hypothetical protein E4P43_03665 [Blastococcus sp. TF02A_35]
MTGPNAPSGGAPAPGRRRLLAAAAVAGAVLALLLGWALWPGGDGDRASEASATSTSPWTQPPAPPTPEPAGPTDVVDEAPPSLDAVGLDETAAVGNGITAEVTGIEAIEGTAVGPGNIAGPALRVTVRIENGTGAPVSLDAVAVDLAYGEDLTPASPLDDPSRSPFSGSVPAGEDREGTYVFTVPEGARDAVTIQVGYQAGAPFLVFRGSAG